MLGNRAPAHSFAIDSKACDTGSFKHGFFFLRGFDRERVMRGRGQEGLVREARELLGRWKGLANGRWRDRQTKDCYG